MDLSEPAPADEWAAVDHLWEDIAEAWFKPDGTASTFLFRVPRGQLLEAGPPVTVARLLDAAAIPSDEVESWHVEDGPPAEPDLGQPLPPPPPDATHLAVYVRLKPPAPPDDDGPEPEWTPEKWQALDATWKAILALEAGIDSLRMGMEGLRSEMEAAFKKSMTVEEKVHALQGDVSQWTKAKSRVHYALPKVREFVHRATWATAGPERKALDELVENHIEPRVPVPHMNRLRERLEHLQKDRQLLFQQGNAVGQECRNILGEIQRAMGALQRNAADRARQKRSAGRDKGKHL